MSCVGICFFEMLQPARLSVGIAGLGVAYITRTSPDFLPRSMLYLGTQRGAVIAIYEMTRVARSRSTRHASRQFTFIGGKTVLRWGRSGQSSAWPPRSWVSRRTGPQLTSDTESIPSSTTLRRKYSAGERELRL